jgi:hypothetical protein
MNRDAADKRYHWRHLQCGSGVAGVFITPSHSLPLAEREFVRPVHLSGDAGFAVLEVAAIAVCPSPLIEVLPRDRQAGLPSKAQAMHLNSLTEETYQTAV